jgi:hypothetical protein
MAVETTFDRSCSSFCISGLNSCCTHSNWRWVIKTGLLDAKGDLASPVAWPGGSAGVPSELFYMRQANYVVMKTDTKILQIRPDGRQRVLATNILKQRAIPSPSGAYIAVLSKVADQLYSSGPGAVTVQIIDACDGTTVVNDATDVNFMGDWYQAHWVDDNSLYMIEYQNDYSCMPNCQLKQFNYRFDPVGRKTASKSISLFTIPTVDGLTSMMNANTPATTSAYIARNGDRFFCGQSLSNFLIPDAYELPVGKAYRCAAIDCIEATTSCGNILADKLKPFGSVAQPSRTSGSFKTSSKCDCGASSVTATTGCKYMWNDGCVSPSTQVSKSSCSLGWWDFASTGKQYKCNTMNDLSTCKAVPLASGAGFIQDNSGDNEQYDDSQSSTRPADITGLDVVMPLLMGVAAVGIVLGVTFTRRVSHTTYLDKKMNELQEKHNHPNGKPVYKYATHEEDKETKV